MTQSDTLPTTDQDKDTKFYEPGDEERFSHYVPKEQLESAIFNGTACLALCGKIWLPTKDATRFPVCQKCKDIYETFKDA